MPLEKKTVPIAEFQAILCCPRCRADLRLADDSFHCTQAECGLTLPIVDNIPILINEDRSVFDISSFLHHKPTYFKPISRLSAYLPVLGANIGTRQNFIQLREMLLQRHDRPRVLVIGGGIAGSEMEPLLDEPAIELIETDVSFGPRTQLVCDAHELPFKSGTFQAVVAQAVLEHVMDPYQCTAEIHRVLCDDGLVYAETPLMQPVHGGAYDFTRFTHSGHRRLFRQFREVGSGVVCGPGMALADAASAFLESFFTSRMPRSVMRCIARLTLFWLKYCDYWLARRDSAFASASGFYFLGERSEKVLTDREIIRAFRGC